MIALQLAFTYAPPFHAAFHSAPIGWQDWLMIASFGAIVFSLMELEKALSNRRRKPA
jgi:hypothetical protein